MNHKNRIRYYIKEAYGKTYYVPVDYDGEIQKLTGKKSVAKVEGGQLDRSTMDALEAMGFSFTEITRTEAAKMNK